MTGRHVLVVMLDGLRALIEAEPAFAAIRVAHRHARIDVVVRERFSPLLRGSPHFDRVIAAGADDGGLGTGLTEAAGSSSYERVYALDGTAATSALRSELAGRLVSEWVGLEPGADRPVRRIAGPAMRKMLFEAGLTTLHRLPDPAFGAAASRGEASRFASSHGIEGAFALLLRTREADRSWGPASWTALAETLCANGVTPVVLAGDGERSPSVSATEPSGAVGLAGIGLLARAARFFVSDGAEATHLALAGPCRGVLVEAEGGAWADAVFGRDVVRLLAGPRSPVEPGLVTDVLGGMGLLAPTGARLSRLA